MISEGEGAVVILFWFVGENPLWLLWRSGTCLICYVP